MTRRRWRQDRVTNELYEVTSDFDRPIEGRVHIQPDTPDFVSPIDGKLVSGRRQMRAHMKQHDVVPSQEFSQDFIAKKAKERTDKLYGRDKESQLERKSALIRAWEQNSGRRNNS